MRRVVLVTGASSGIGQATARLLARRGLAVFGTSRDPSSRTPPPDLELLRLDVRSDDSVRDCVGAVLARAGRLDVLINCAGYALVGPIEEATTEQLQAQFETNVFGMVRTIKHSLPIMRRQRSGQIINVSSGMSIARAPFLGLYAASKCAVDGYTEALWHELRPFNISVSLVLPGFVRTGIGQSATEGNERIAAYEPWREGSRRFYEEAIRTGLDAEVVAGGILRLVMSRKPAFCYRTPSVARLALMRRLLPESAFRWVIGRYVGLPGPSPGARKKQDGHPV